MIGTAMRDKVVRAVSCHWVQPPAPGSRSSMLGNTDAAVQGVESHPQTTKRSESTIEGRHLVIERQRQGREPGFRPKIRRRFAPCDQRGEPMLVSRRLGIDMDRARIVRKPLPGRQSFSRLDRSPFMATRLLARRSTARRVSSQVPTVPSDCCCHHSMATSCATCP